MTEHYIEISCEVPGEQAEVVTEFLETLSPLALTSADAKDQPILEPKPNETPLWPQVIVTALFQEPCPTNALLAAIREFDAHLEPVVKILPNQDWTTAWQAHFKPICFADKLWVCPSWALQDMPLDATVVRLDPGVAFGTGTHPTTAMCLTWLATHAHEQQTLIDYGCGSGILAIAGLKLGIQTAIGVDYDPQAITATAQNAEYNEIAKDRLIGLLPQDAEQIAPADIVIANILANPLLELAPRLCAAVKKCGAIALSGILESQAPEIIEAYAPWIRLEIVNQQEEWVLLAGVHA